MKPGRPDMQVALRSRDVTTIFQLLKEGGMTQRQIAALVKMSQSEICEILNGRQVQSYDVLVRVADGLGIPRGQMGLAYECQEPPPTEEVDEDVERRKLMALAGAILFGSPVFGEPKPLTVRHVLSKPPGRIGPVDVEMYEKTVTRLGLLDRQVGGLAASEPLVAAAAAGEELLKAEAAPAEHQRLRYAVAEAHRLAAGAAGDLGLVDRCRYHIHAALDLAKGDPLRIAQILCTAGTVEKNYGDPNEALKLLQLAQIGAGYSDFQASAVLAAETVAAYASVGHLEKARQELQTARTLFGQTQTSSSLPFFASYAKGYGVLASCELKLGNHAAALAYGAGALSSRPAFDVRCRALDTVILATTNMRAGEIRQGIHETQKALALASQVGSRRVRDRLEPLEQVLAARRDSTCQDLAREVRKMRTVEA